MSEQDPINEARISILGIMTDHQLAQLLDVKVETLASWRIKDEGPPYSKLGKAVFYRIEDIHTWAEQKRVVPGAT